jgi:hypothetical protein
MCMLSSSLWRDLAEGIIKNVSYCEFNLYIYIRSAEDNSRIHVLRDYVWELCRSYVVAKFT